MTWTACAAACKSCLRAVSGSAVPAGVAVLYLLVVADPLHAQWGYCNGSSICYSSGNVGIGTTTPGSNVSMLNGLTINGTGSTMLSVQNGGNNAFALNAGSDGSWTLYDNASGFWAASITSTRGFVGIGTTAPATPLQIGNTTLYTQDARITTATANGSGNSRSWSIGSKYGGATVSSPNYGFTIRDETAGVERMVIDWATGNVGIGTTTPRTNLDVNGQIIARLMTLAQDTGTTSPTWQIQNAGGLFRLYWQPNIYTAGSAILYATTSGNIGILESNPQYALSVNGTIQAREVLVNTAFADYVFDPAYRVRPLSEVAAFIKSNHHLPDIPSAAEVKEKGVPVGEMESKLLAKVEELTLHMIELSQKNEDLQKRITELERQKPGTK